MSLSANKIILATAVTNTAGAYFLTTTLTAVNTANGTVIPAGMYVMFPSTNATVMAANVGGVVISDGYNVYAKSSYASGDTVTLLSPNGGQAVSGTYNS